jgi:hypothetical protein
MLKLEGLLNDPSHLFRVRNRHIVALCNLSIQVGLQDRVELVQGQRQIVRTSVRIDLTAAPDAIVECVDVGLVLNKDGYVTVSHVVQEALAEWLDETAFAGSFLPSKIP